MAPDRHFKIRPASMVDPDPVLARAPAVSARACGFAMLRHHPHVCVSCFHRAAMLSHVAGTARNRLKVSVSIVASVPVVGSSIMIPVTIGVALVLKDGRASHRKIRAASVIHPNPLLIRAPAVTLGASRVAALR